MDFYNNQSLYYADKLTSIAENEQDVNYKLARAILWNFNLRNVNYVDSHESGFLVVLSNNVQQIMVKINPQLNGEYNVNFDVFDHDGHLLSQSTMKAESIDDLNDVLAPVELRRYTA